MLATHSARWFLEWVAYSLVEPFGEKRADLRAAMQVATLRNAFRGEDDDPVSVEDVMPRFGPETDDEAEEDRERKREEIQKKIEKALS